MRLIKRVSKIGNSLWVSINDIIVKKLKLKKGDHVEVEFIRKMKRK